MKHPTEVKPCQVVKLPPSRLRLQCLIALAHSTPSKTDESFLLDALKSTNNVCCACRIPAEQCSLFSYLHFPCISPSVTSECQDNMKMLVGLIKHFECQLYWMVSNEGNPNRSTLFLCPSLILLWGLQNYIRFMSSFSAIAMPARTRSELKTKSRETGKHSNKDKDLQARLSEQLGLNGQWERRNECLEPIAVENPATKETVPEPSHTHQRRLPRPQKLFKRRSNYEQIQAIAKQKYPLKANAGTCPPIS